MTAPTAFTEGLLLYLSIICAIGPQNVFLLQQGANRNRPAQFATASAVADISLMSLGALGFSAVLIAMPAFHVILAGAGALFLAIYGTLSLTEALKNERPGPSLPMLGQASLATWAAITLLNPVYYVDNLVLIGGTAAASEGAARLGFLAGACFGALLWFFGLVIFAEKAGPILFGARAKRFLSFFCAVVTLYTSTRIMAGMMLT